MSNTFKFTNKECTSVHVSGDINATVPKGHRFWVQYGIKDAIEAGEVQFITETEVVNPFPEVNEEFLTEGESVVELFEGEENGVQVKYNKSVVTMELKALEDVLAIRLEELKELRKNARELGFTYKGYTIIADRDAQNDLTGIITGYLTGTTATDAVTPYKVGANEYMMLNGQAEVLAFGQAFNTFTQVECFGKEAAVAAQLALVETVEELIAVDLTELFLPDHTTDMYVDTSEVTSEVTE